MSVDYRRVVDKIRRFIQENPALAHVPFLLVGGKPITPMDALKLALKNDRRVLQTLRQLDPTPEETWVLAEEYYRRLVSANPNIRIFSLGRILPPDMSLTEILDHIRKRDEIGLKLMVNYQRLVRFMRERMNA